MKFDDSSQPTAGLAVDRWLSHGTEAGADVCCDPGEDASSDTKRFSGGGYKTAGLRRAVPDEGADESQPLWLLLRVSSLLSVSSALAEGSHSPLSSQQPPKEGAAVFLGL